MATSPSEHSGSGPRAGSHLPRHLISPTAAEDPAPSARSTTAGLRISSTRPTTWWWARSKAGKPYSGGSTWRCPCEAAAEKEARDGANRPLDRGSPRKKFFIGGEAVIGFAPNRVAEIAAADLLLNKEFD